MEMQVTAGRVPVRFTRRVVAGGVLYSVGEVAAVQLADLDYLGDAAEPIGPPLAATLDTSKSLDGPPSHKMASKPSQKKEGYG